MKRVLDKEEEVLLENLKELITYSDFYFHIKDTKKDKKKMKKLRKKIQKGKGDVYQDSGEE